MKIRLINNVLKTSVELDPSDDSSSHFYPMVSVTINKRGFASETPAMVSSYHCGQLNAELARSYGLALNFAGWIARQVESLRSENLTGCYRLICENIKKDRRCYGMNIVPVDMAKKAKVKAMPPKQVMMH